MVDYFVYNYFCRSYNFTQYNEHQRICWDWASQKKGFFDFLKWLGRQEHKRGEKENRGEGDQI